MDIEQLNTGSCKTYLIRSDSSNEVVLVDPVLDRIHEYLDYIERSGSTLKYVIDTHTHADHISGCAAMKDITGCSYIMHTLSPAVCADIKVNDGDTMDLVPGKKFHFIHTPGHTKDAVSIAIEDVLLTGDALFLDDGGAGRDDLPGGDPGEHWESLKELSKMPDDMIIHPAHDYRGREPSSLSEQKRTNPHLKTRTKEEYIQYLEDLKLGPADWMKDVLEANYTCARDPNVAWIPIDTPSCEVKGTMDKNANEQIVDIITPDELRELLATEPEKVLMIDVREPDELRSELGYIRGVKNIPLLEFSKDLKSFKEHGDREMVMVCRSGSRAYTAGQLMKQVGMDNVKVLKDGMLGWLGLEVT